MRNIVLGLIVSTAVSGVASAEFEGVIETKITSTGGHASNATGKTYVSKAGWRSEVEMQMPDFGQGKPGAAKAPGTQTHHMVMMGKLAEPGRIYSLNESTKTYAVINTNDMKTPGQNQEKWTIKRLGKDSVAGLGCEKVLATEEGQKRQIEACISREILTGDWLKSMESIRRGTGWMQAVKDAGVQGFPVRMVMSSGEPNSPRTTMEVTRIERQSVPSSLFEVPAGYKESSVMGTMMSPEAQKAMQKAMENMTPEQRRQMEEMMKKMGQPTPKPN